ncbi:MAG TPA: hypothetical protein VFY75_00595 [Solirubrobacterales bacterium]|nr:hypothetical protein [Solirubrobacterales bacterium]
MSFAVTQPQTAFAEPGLEIETAALRSLYQGLRELLAEFTSELPTDADVEELELQLDLPERYATPFGQALIAADIAWRIGWMAAEEEESRLGSVDADSVNLNELLPVEECGLEIVSIEDGSIKAKLLAAKDKISYDSAVATIALALQFGSMIGVNASTSTEPLAMQPIPSKVHEKAESAVKQLPGLPPGTQAITRVTLSDGTIIEFVAADTIQ